MKAALADPTPKVYVNGLSSVAALARNCFLNEYVYFEPADETTLVAILEAAIESDFSEGNSLDALKLAVYGCYRPLNKLQFNSSSNQFGDSDDSAIAGLLKYCIVEPAEIESLEAEFPQITPIDDQTLITVRDQYEENPYPRWTSCARHSPLSFAESLKKYFPAADPESARKISKPNILIAGCGTGQHVVETASKYANASIVAIDLSRPSLAYAKYKSTSYGMQDIDYAVADILHLHEVPEFLNQFDLIEAAGSLHHLSDPLAGMRALVACLKPGGVMQVGLYSSLARANLATIRQIILEQGFKPTREDIRKLRKYIFDSLSAHRELSFLPSLVTRSEDFYSISMCRDLVFHAQEITFTPLDVVALVKESGLNFLGFKFQNTHLLQSYLELFPDDPLALNPKNVAVFESKNPESFLGMYNFYTQKSYS